MGADSGGHFDLRAELFGMGGRFTNLFEALAIDVLLAANVKKAAAILRITWDEAWHLMERAVINWLQYVGR